MTGGDGSARLMAIKKLIDQFGSKYQKDKFVKHNDIEFFYTSDRGVHVKATKDIAAEEVVLKIPHNECTSYLSMLAKDDVLLVENSDRNGGADVTLSTVLDAIFEASWSQEGKAWEFIRASEVVTTVLIMFLWHNPTLFAGVVATWPSQAQMEDYFSRKANLLDDPTLASSALFFEGSFIEQISRQARESNNTACDLVASILNRLDVAHRFGLGEEHGRWRTIYNVASSIVETRAHDSTFAKHEFKSLQIWPLLDCFNGLPEKAKAVNLKSNETEAAGVQVVCTVPIKKGEELFLSYGQSTASHFTRMYGVCPDCYWQDNLLSLGLDYVLMKIPEKYRIDESDKVRQGFLETFRCESYRNEHFLFPPSLLIAWHTKGNFPWCLRDMFLYLRIQEDSSSDCDGAKEVNGTKEEDERPSSNDMMQKVLEIVEASRPIVQLPESKDKSASLRERMVALIESSKDAQERSAAILQLLACDSWSMWRTMIVKNEKECRKEMQKAYDVKMQLIKQMKQDAVDRHSKMEEEKRQSAFERIKRVSMLFFTIVLLVCYALWWWQLKTMQGGIEQVEA